jgi:hypothetical protein
MKIPDCRDALNATNVRKGKQRRWLGDPDPGIRQIV